MGGKHGRLPIRSRCKPGLLDFGGYPSTSEELLVRVQDALAEENTHARRRRRRQRFTMLTGAGWPLHLADITPYLDLFQIAVHCSMSAAAHPQ